MRSQEKTSTVSFKSSSNTHVIFRFADWVDIVLMVLGTVGAIGDGMSTNVALVFASRIMNSLGYGQHNPSSTTFKEEIQKCSLYFVYLGLAILGVAFMGNVPTFLMHISVFITGLLFSAYFSWRLTVVAIPTLVLLLIPGLIYGKYLVHLSKKSFKEHAKANSIVEQALSSFKTILSFTAETQIIKKYSEVLERHKKLGLKQGLAKGLAVGSSGISFTIWAFLAWYGSRLVMHKQETGGRIYAAGISFVLSGISLGTALTEIRYFSEASVAAARICSRIDRISEIDGEDTTKGFIPGDKMKGRVEFEHVTFIYPCRPKSIILKDFTLTADVVAHKLSTVRGANIIAMLENGSVKELGSHEDLMTNNNHYAKLVNLQRQCGHEHRQDLQDRVKTPEIQQRWSTMNCVNRLSRRSSPDLIDSPYPLESINTAKINDNHPSTSFTRLLPLVSPEWKSSLVGCISAATFGAIQPVYALTIGGMISAFFAKSSQEMQAKIRIYSLIFTSLTFLSITLNLLQHYSFAKMGERLMQRLRLKMLEQIFTFEPAWFDVEENFSGELCSRLSNEVSIVKSLVADRLSLLVQTISGVTIAMIIGLLLSWKLALVMIAVQPLSILCFYTKKVLLSNISHNYAYAQNRSSQIASEAIYNHKIITSLGSTKKIIEIFDKAQYKAKRKGRKAAWLAGFGMGSAQCLTFLTWALDFWYGGVLVQKGEISAGDVFKTFFVLVSTGKVIAEAGSMTSDLAKGSAAMSSVFKILDRPSSQENTNHGAKIETLIGRIELKNIDFSYPNQPSIPVLRQFSLDIKPGTSIGLVGISGCGKSTVIALIQRFYDVEIGCVKIDSVDLRDIDIKWYRKHTALVSQEPVVYSGTLIMANRKMTTVVVAHRLNTLKILDCIAMIADGTVMETGSYDHLKNIGGQFSRLVHAHDLKS
ncbi:predicted protein [Arabidopsis lyrata subsp. lyrata]|uniref:Predicted protein n=1 Tax=Arabidopsis lyrata subsp. lyrata TaxID=81972 RepID=D7LP84_ARALL|nr:predicted protein [Arabidopsis lyrata subsp. lyrata]